MSLVVCIVCDAEKACATRDRYAHCNVCMRTTANRLTARPSEPITPESALTFAKQREIFEQERRRA